MKERERGWQPFVFAECIDIKLHLNRIFLHHYIFNVNYMLYKCNQSDQRNTVKVFCHWCYLQQDTCYSEFSHVF